MRQLVTVFLLAAAVLSAQNVSCLLSGTLHDPTGAVVPAAEVKLTATTTGFVRTTRTNNEGFFSFPDLTPSTFDLSISARGFKNYVQTEITINASEQRSLGVIQMQLGGTTETVSVTAEAAPVMTASGERSTAITEKELSALALKSRDVMEVIRLVPGVVDTNETRETPTTSGANGVYILGARHDQKNMTIDGVTNQDVGDSTGIVSTPSVDSIAEVKVLMANYAAEYGRNAGGTITIITKGGGKQFHATGGWYHRHEQFTANNYFNNRNGVQRPRYRYNIFSYTVGGPIYIPRKFNSDRSKLFFFFSQEFARQLVASAATTLRVPTAAERAGDFSQTYDINARLITVNDPQNNKTPFPGNVVPAARFNRSGQNALKLFPLPNFVDPLPARLYQWNFIISESYQDPRSSETVRVDYSPRSNLQFYGRFNKNDETRFSGGTSFPLGLMWYPTPSWSASLHGTFVFSPTLFNEILAGLPDYAGPVYLLRNIASATRKATGIEIAQWYPANNPDNVIPSMSFGGVSNAASISIGSDYPGYTNSVSPTLVDNVSKIYRTHTMKFGIYLERSRKNRAVGTNIRGTVAFARNTSNPLDTNFAYANALIGVFDSYTEATARPQGRLRFTNFEWYAQDDWRIRPRLFLNYGVRFYHNQPVYDLLNQFCAFSPNLYDPSQAPVLLRPALSGTQQVAVDPRTGATYPSVRVGTFAPGTGNPAIGMVVGGKNGVPRSIFTFPAAAVAPRLGFSWDPFGNGRTAIRGGAGVYYNRSLNSPWTYLLINPPSVFTPAIYYSTLEGLSQTAGQAILAPPSLVRSVVYGQPQNPETVYNFSFGIQRQISRRQVLDVSYAGALSRHLWWARNVNPVPIGAQFLDVHPENRNPAAPSSALPVNFLRPYQGYGDINMWHLGATSNYNALQVAARRQMSRGFVSLGYAFSKALGSASTWDTLVSPFFAPRQRNYGPLTYDRTNVLTLSYNYRLPHPGKYLHQRWMSVVTDHWEVSGTTRFMSGAPFTPSFSTVDGANITGTPTESARPDVLNPTAEPVARFGRPARGTFGNTGQNVLRGPGVNNWDISIYRRIPLGEGGKHIQLRFETYNAFNHTQFSTVSQSARFDAQGNQVDTLFLQPTAARTPRRVQLAMRIAW